MAELISDCKICDRKAECFKHLTDEELKLFSDNKSTIHYRKGETIIKQGTEFTHVVSFNSGLAKLNVEISPKKRMMIGLIKPSEILGGPGMFSDNRYTFSVIALIDSSICLLNVDTFKKIIRVNEKFADTFLSSFSNRYIQAIDRLVTITQKQMHGRVAEALLYFSDTIFNSDNFELVLSRQELAEYTSMSKESISRILKDLNTENIIETKGKIVSILNKEKLILLKETG
jgi:CRP/FNR family transcriptional regulator, polysaccharide utilization system transcription regulator